MPQLYDLILMLDPAAPDDRRAKIVDDVEQAVSSEGSVASRHDWGKRALVYEIGHRPEAEYHLLQFSGGPELLERLGRNLRVTDEVVRFRIIKVKPGTPDPVTPRPAPVTPDAAASPDATAAPDAPPPAPADVEAPPAGEPTQPAPEAQPTPAGDVPPEGDQAAEPAGAGA